MEGTATAATTRSEGDAIARTERWFLSRGVPHFIHRYDAAKDILTRTLPLLALVFLFELANALNLDWPWWANILAVIGGFAILLGAFAGSNLLRRRRLLARPDRVGIPEMVVFVAAPSLLPLVFGGQLRSAAVTLGANLLLLLVIYLGTSYGVVPMARWAAGRLLRQIGDLVGLVGRALPLLILIIGLLLLTNEVWQVAASLNHFFFLAALAMLAITGVLFVVVRMPREMASLERFGSWEEARRLAADTPAAAFDPSSDEALHSVPPPRRRQWGNAVLVVLFSQGLQILSVSVAVTGFLLLFGLIAITPATIQLWTGAQVHVIADIHLGGGWIVLSEELLRVCEFLGAFSGLYFTVYALADPTYRAEFFEDATREVRQAFAVRALYLAELGVTGWEA